MEQILVLDDERNVGHVLDQLLHRNGYGCTYASSAAGAREVFEKDHIDLVISDIRMPEESGDFVRWARAKNPDLAILIVTGAYDKETAREALQLDVYGYILKPFEPNQVLISVLNALRRRDLEKEARRHREDLERTVAERTAELQDKIKSIEQAQKALRESEERYRSAIELSNDGVSIVCRGRMIYANQRLAEIHGYDRPDELIGQPVSQFLHPDEIDRVKVNLAIRDEGQEAPSRDETHVLRKDGTSVFVEVSVTSIIHRGEPCTLCFIRDVTDRRASEDALRESEERYRTAIELSNDGVAISSRGKYLYVNRRFAEIHGYEDPEEFIGKPVTAFAHPDEIEQVKALQANREAGGDAPSLHERRRIRKDGRVIFVDISANRIIYKGEPCTLAFLRDITQRKKTQEALKESEKRFRAIAESAQEAIIQIGRGGRVSYWNRAAEKILGFSEKEAIGREYYPLLLPEKSRDAHRRAFERFEETGQGGAVGKTVEAVALRKNGEEFPVDLSVSAVRIRTVWNAVLILRDISERKKLEGRLLKKTKGLEETRAKLEAKNQEIELNSEKLASALDEISSLVQKVAKEKDFSIRFGNPTLVKCHEFTNCRQTRCPCHGKEAVRCWQVAGTYCNGEVQGSFAKKIQNCCKECRVFTEVTQDPVFRVGEHFNNMMHILEGKNKSLQAAYKELKNSQALVIQQEKMASIGQLAAGVAHEINNPTGFISSNLKTLSEYVKDLLSLLNAYKGLTEKVGAATAADRGLSEELKNIRSMEADLDVNFILEDAGKLVEESREGTDRIKKIVLDLKDFAHPGKQEMVYANINRNLESTLNIVWNEIKYKAKVTKAFGALPEVRCYPQQMNQVFMNILMNAAQAIEKEGEIAIATKADNRHVEVRISDTGIGIPNENLSKIFEPFFTTKEVGKGTGLGLNVAYNIVKKHRGTIEAESVVGKGTTFTVRIPVEGPVEAPAHISS